METENSRDFIVAQDVRYEGPGGKMICSRSEGRWAGYLDTYCWDWEYINGYQKFPNFFKVRHVRITIPNRPKSTLANKTVFVFVADKFRYEKEMCANIIAEAGGFALVVDNFPIGESEKEILTNLRAKLTAKKHNEYWGRAYSFYYPQKWNSDMLGVVQSFLWVDDSENPVIGIWHIKEGRADGNIKKTIEAFNHGRQCRFEWGQYGYQKSEYQEEIYNGN